MAAKDPRRLDTLYGEVCRAHDGIARFRARLLALLPIASAAGVAFLVVGENRDAAFPLLLPMGVFGVLITAGLFLYELRGIQRCNALIRSAKLLEREMAGDLGSLGTFRARPESVGLAGATGAALVIYPSVIGAWTYVAGVGVAGAPDPGCAVLVTAGALAAGSAALGKRILSLQGDVIDRKFEDIEAILEPTED